MKKQILFLFILFVSFFISVNALTEQEIQNLTVELDNVTVEYHGAWQWGSDTYHRYSILDLKNEDFDLDLDDSDERSLKLVYGLGPITNVYELEMQRSVQGSDYSRIIAKKNGNVCFNEGKEIDTAFDTLVDLASQCGFKFEAEWEIATFETDMQLHNFEIAKSEKADIISRLTNLENVQALNTLAGQISNANNNYRVREILTQFNKLGPTNYLYSSTEFFDETGTGQTRILVITNDKKILYVILIEEEILEDLIVFKPTKNVTIESAEVNNYEKLLGKLDDSSFFTKLDAADAEDPNYWSTVQGATLVGGSTVAAGAGVIIGFGAGTAAISSLAATGAAGLAWIAFPIAIIAVGVGYSVWYFTDTDSSGYDNGGLVINWDNELFSTWAEKEVNFMLVNLAAEPTIGAVPVSNVVFTPEKCDNADLSDRPSGKSIIVFSDNEINHLNKALNLSNLNSQNFYDSLKPRIKVNKIISDLGENPRFSVQNNVLYFTNQSRITSPVQFDAATISVDVKTYLPTGGKFFSAKPFERNKWYVLNITNSEIFYVIRTTDGSIYCESEDFV